MQNRITRAFSNLAKNIVKLFQAPGRRRKKQFNRKRAEVKERKSELKRAGVENNESLKKLKAFEGIFKEKHGKSIYSRKLTEEENEEAADIFNMFLEDKLSTTEGIEEEYEKLSSQGLVGDADTIAQMAKKVDVVKNVEAADRVHSVLGSQTEKLIWMEVRSNPDKYNVPMMAQAIENVTDELESMDPSQRGSTGQRVQMVLDEYRRLMEEGL